MYFFSTKSEFIFEKVTNQIMIPIGWFKGLFCFAKFKFANNYNYNDNKARQARDQFSPFYAILTGQDCQS